MVFAVQPLLRLVLLDAGNQVHQATLIYDLVSLTDDELRIVVVQHQAQFGEVCHVNVFLLGRVRAVVAMEHRVVPLGKTVGQVGDFFLIDYVVREVIRTVVVYDFRSDALCVFGMRAIFGMPFLAPAHHEAHIVAVLHQVDGDGPVFAVHYRDRLCRHAVEKRVGKHRHIGLSVQHGKQRHASAVHRGAFRLVVHGFVFVVVAPHYELVIARGQFNFLRIVVREAARCFLGNLLQETAFLVEYKHIDLAYLLTEEVNVLAVLLRVVHKISQGKFQCARSRLRFRLGSNRRRAIGHVLLNASGKASHCKQQSEQRE